MEESDTEWKGFVIRYADRCYHVINKTRHVSGRFTTLQKAKAYIDARVSKETNEQALKEYNKQLKIIRAEPDLRKRSRMWKKLCQAYKK